MRKLLFLGIVALILSLHAEAGTRAQSGAFILIEDGEFQRELSYQKENDLDPFTSPVPGLAFEDDTAGAGITRGFDAVDGAPEIVIETPDPDNPPTPPFDILVRFVAHDGAKIDMSSFRCLYGFLRINITGRLMEHAEVFGNVLQVEDAAIPPGKHTIVLEIKDTEDRKNRLRLKFRVREA